MKILVLPKDPNPYQELLYSNFPSQFERKYITWPINKFSTLTFMPTIVAKLMYYRIRGYRLVHLHWTYLFSVDKRLPFSRLWSTINNYLFLYTILLLRMELVWTVHNLLPHEKETLDDERIIRQLIKYCSLVIAHSSSVLKQMKDHNFDTSRTKIIPIGGYGGIHSNKISRDEARKRLGISKYEFVILFFGIIRPYKGLDDLLHALHSVKPKRTRLVIAGKCEDKKLAQQIQTLSVGLKTDFYNQFIPDEDIATYFNACDVVCLPFKKITTSSSILLGMAFEKATIAPNLGAVTDLPKDIGFLYNPAEKNSLEKALSEATKSKGRLKAMGKAAKSYSDGLSWDKIAAKTYGAYEEVLERDKKSAAWTRP